MSHSGTATNTTVGTSRCHVLALLARDVFVFVVLHGRRTNPVESSQLVSTARLAKGGLPLLGRYSVVAMF